MDTQTCTKILLSNETTEEEKLMAANLLIEISDLQLTPEEIIMTFKYLENRITNSCMVINFYNSYKKFLDVLLNKNKNMYIAIVKMLACNNKFDYFMLIKYILYRKHKKGHICLPNYSYVVKLCCTLLDYHDFDTDNLLIPEKYKVDLREYRTKKYSGKLTKAAIKN